MKLPIFDPSPSGRDALVAALALRHPMLQVIAPHRLHTLQARVKDAKADALLIMPRGLTTLAERARRRGIRVLRLRVDLERRAISQMADQLLDLLGLARSAVADAVVLERLGGTQLARVRWPGIEGLVLLAKAHSLSLQEAQIRRLVHDASAVRGPGLAETIETYWDDPVPHLLQMLPEGSSLFTVAQRLGALPLDVVLSVARGVAEGVASFHAAGMTAGSLSPDAIGLCGEVLLLGGGLRQVPCVPNEDNDVQVKDVPPEEFLARLPEQLPDEVAPRDWRRRVAEAVNRLS